MDLIKIDVEGAELMVLRGAERCLREFRPVLLLEIDEPNFRMAGYSRTDLFSYLRSLEYRVPVGADALRMPEKCDAVCYPDELNTPVQILAAD
jgi:hypothetical protein